jgi:iron complex outermembrane receptor protein
VPGQTFILNDTIRIGEVVIKGKTDLAPAPGNKNLMIDSAIIRDYNHSSIADIISENSHIFIKSYGSGGSATVSFRGTGASHTQVSWNNVNINHPMLGQSDLSLLPAGFIDDIQVLFGSASLAVNSGGLGGTINIETLPEWNNETCINANIGSGSFGRYSGLAKIRTGTNKFQSSTKIMMQSSENNFRYLNTQSSDDPKWERRKNAEMNQKGVMQELYFKGNRKVTSAHLWYQSAERQLPSVIIADQVNPGEKQTDDFLRTLLNIRGSANKNDYDISVSASFSNLHYTNTPASIDSRNKSATYIAKAGIEKPVGKNSSLSFVLNEELNMVNSNNYDGLKNRNIASVSASAKSSVGKRVKTNFLLRQLIFNKTLLVPDFYAGFDLNLLHNDDLVLKGNISRNSRIPTLNDNFWMPGGNPDLKNEYAHTYELTCALEKRILESFVLKTDLTFYFLSVRDMIQWQPGEFSYFTPRNIQNVNSSGIETSMNINYSVNNFTLRLNTGYSLTRSVEKDKGIRNPFSGPQLIYVPEHKFNAGLRLLFRNLYSTWQTNFTGIRFITPDNSQFLPAFILNDLVAGFKAESGSKALDLNIKIENIFNVNYQAIAYYPMPGRSYFVSLIVQLKK